MRFVYNIAALLAIYTTETTAFVSSPRSAMTFVSSLPSTMDDAAVEAQALRDKAAQLRAEIATMEGKTIHEVESEAKEKKDREIKAAEERKNRRANEVPLDRGRMVEVPVTRDDMVAQAARAVERAYRDGVTRQTVRFFLLQEKDSFTSSNQWPGGAQQMYREAAKPLARELLRSIRVSSEQILSPVVKDQEIWDFDGSALHSAEAQEGAKFDVQALVFPNTDVKYIKDIETIDHDMKDRLFLLVNPFWRSIDSWGINLLAPGAKKKAQKVIFDRGFDETYVCLRFSCRGEECVAIKAYPYDWQIFAYLEDGYGMETPIRLGCCKEEPKSELVTTLLNGRPEFKFSKNMRQMSR
ncbi:hypothetical protein FisN_5Lh221 [Fistulifera solaris]|uniref:DUF1995 domain-containing protein n=1 Tax=Fistulifera solaris TaxID=1519565 RepID=A0A1Z5JIQ6_FISSO|nr:hypothetical protein FisN_5Lh221 [Fistulifera solaris]|eukprot:GAX13883.1 hypothetical protein FisN_5Lh221 [Fistulifera solaris]